MKLPQTGFVMQPIRHGKKLTMIRLTSASRFDKVLLTILLKLMAIAM